MCLFSTRPKWEDDVEFARPARKTRTTYTARPASRRISETIIRESRPSVQYLPAPERASTPIIRVATPPRASTPPPQIELVSVEEARSSPRASKVSVSNKGKSRRGSSRGEVEEYIERERIRERMSPVPPQPQYETYRYVEGPREQRYVEESRSDRQRSKSITYETNPRHSGRVVERERVVIEDGGRRREYYRRP